MNPFDYSDLNAYVAHNTPTAASQAKSVCRRYMKFYRAGLNGEPHALAICDALCEVMVIDMDLPFSYPRRLRQWVEDRNAELATEGAHDTTL